METLLLLKNKKARSGMRYEPTFDGPLRGESLVLALTA
jgi:hypothetical protein